MFALPEIAPYESGKGENQIQAGCCGVKFPILIVHAACPRFKQISQRAGGGKTDGQFDKMMAEVFARKLDDAEQACSQERGIGENQRQQQ